jgi:hypothetical protein
VVLHYRSILATVTICALLLTTTESSRAQTVPAANTPFFDFHFGRDIALASVGLGAAIGVGIYFARRGHRLTGCAAPSPNGLQLQNEGDHRTYALTGNVAAIKPGEIVRVSGKKEKHDAAGGRPFLVKKLSKDFGTCKVRPTTP